MLAETQITIIQYLLGVIFGWILFYFLERNSHPGSWSRDANLVELMNRSAREMGLVGIVVGLLLVFFLRLL